MNDSTPEYQNGGGVPDGPVYVERRDVGPVFRFGIDTSRMLRQLEAVSNAVSEFTRHMADQDPQVLEADRAEAWGYTYDPLRHSPDAMSVSFGKDAEK